MKKTLYLSAFLSLAGFSFSQLCTPTFASGCFSWNTKSVDVGSISWAFDEMDCYTYNYTAVSTVINAGDDIPMTVSSGNWCGCSVWVDFDNDGQYDDSENLFHEGNGSTEIAVFDFNINVPETTVNGQYVIRIISSWGSDGFTPGENGSGGCGDYQYGNYLDFTIDVTGGQTPLSVQESELKLSIHPNPANDKLAIENKGLSASLYEIFSTDGSKVLAGKITGNKQEIIISTLNPGVYFLQTENSPARQKFVKL